MRKWMEHAAKAGRGILSLLYPHTCPFCGRVTREEVCEYCAGQITYITEPRCMKCGKPIRSETEEYCYDCGHKHHYYDRGLSLWVHQSGVQSSVYRFKYQNRRIYGRFYAEKLAEKYESAIRRWEIGLIIPIPLYRKRRRERGYNQSELVARELGKILKIPVDTRVLRRTRNTNPQKKLDVRKRRDNLKHAFSVQGRLPAHMAVLLIDDIYTTGNTIDYAAKILKKAGAGKVYFLTISIGQGY